MPRTNLWSQSVPRVELDQRSREARLRLERIEQQPIRSNNTPLNTSGDNKAAAAAPRPGNSWRARTLAKLGKFDRSAAADDERR